MLSTEDAEMLNRSEAEAANCPCGNAEMHQDMNRAAREAADILRGDLPDISDVDIARVLIALNKLLAPHLPDRILAIQHFAACELTKLARGTEGTPE
jgi:hypothetical protein